MRKITFILMWFVLLNSCSNRIKKTYYKNGKLESEYSVDKDNKKDGLYKVFDVDGSYGEITMLHDTMSGFAKYYYESGKLKSTLSFDRGIYSVPFTDSDFVFTISHYSFIENHSYGESGNLNTYVYTRVEHQKINGILVSYLNDSISRILGTPIIDLYEYLNDETKKRNHIERMEVRNIPKCSRSFYVMDSMDQITDSCINCKYIDVLVDRSKYHTLKIVFTDSTYKIKHAISGPLWKWDKRKFPNVRPQNWTRE